MKNVGSGLWVIRSFVHSATLSPHLETWGVSICKDTPPASCPLLPTALSILDSIATSWCSLFVHFLWPALVGKDPPWRAHRQIYQTVMWKLFQGCNLESCLVQKKTNSWNRHATTPVNRLGLSDTTEGWISCFSKWLYHPGAGPTWNFLMSTFQWCWATGWISFSVYQARNCSCPYCFRELKVLLVLNCLKELRKASKNLEKEFDVNPLYLQVISFPLFPPFCGVLVK